MGGHTESPPGLPLERSHSEEKNNYLKDKIPKGYILKKKYFKIETLSNNKKRLSYILDKTKNAKSWILKINLYCIKKQITLAWNAKKS